ncbi:MAG: metallophosphoesterase family protein, partial [Lachnospiraceae bacterium]|nr:metallophosphoesterase family protein [Lachnospiraceae bacterium]
MRILVISDTHGDLQHLETVLAEEGDFDMLLHCGDICGDEDRVRQMVMCAFL